ncbi:MAG TPA: aldose epimerase family protein [Chthoniobacterales bacterium]
MILCRSSCEGNTSPYGEGVELFTLTNRHGLQAQVTNYGARLVSLHAPDRNGKPADVVLGFDTPAGYEQPNPYFGAIVGRYGNRIAHGRFLLDGHQYQLGINDRGNHLHGGTRGFDKVTWAIDPAFSGKGAAVQLTYVSPDGEEGYPGTLETKVEYRLTDENALEIDYQATADQPTVVNLTNHSYFNLAGAGASPITGHVLMINSDQFIPTDAAAIPLGELSPVKGTPFDFRSSTPIGARIDQDNQQLAWAKGYDHTWVLNRNETGLAHAATVHDPASGRVMEVLTTEPGVQFYAGNQLDGTVTGKHGVPYPFRSGFCLETQHYPDSPNRPAFPSTVLRPGETLTSRTVFRFSAA